jgi:hypothetical protein
MEVTYELWRMAYQSDDLAGRAAFDLAARRYREKEKLRALLSEWEAGVYDGPDFLRRVRLAICGVDGLHRPPEDDDRSAVAFWLSKSHARREVMALAFERIAAIFREAPAGTGMD